LGEITKLDLILPSWNDIEQYLLGLSYKLIFSKNVFDELICIYRGGACPSRILADFLNIKKINTITIQYYEDINKHKEAPIIGQAFTVNLTGKTILICDDISDTGKSLKTVKHYLMQQGCTSIITVTIYVKPWTEFIPDYYSQKTDKWIVFPWERVETISRIVEHQLKEGKPLKELKHELLSTGFPWSLLEFYFSTYFKKKKKRKI